MGNSQSAPVSPIPPGEKKRASSAYTIQQAVTATPNGDLSPSETPGGLWRDVVITGGSPISLAKAKEVAKAMMLTGRIRFLLVSEEVTAKEVRTVDFE